MLPSSKREQISASRARQRVSRKFLRPERPAHNSPGRSALCAALGLRVEAETSPDRAQERQYYQDLTPLQGFAVETVLTQGYAKGTLRPGLLCAGLSGLKNLFAAHGRGCRESLSDPNGVS